MVSPHVAPEIRMADAEAHVDDNGGRDRTFFVGQSGWRESQLRPMKRDMRFTAEPP